MWDNEVGDHLLHYSCKYEPTELLQGWESAEVSFDGHLIGRWQVRQALEGARYRQVIWLRLWRQDAAYPIVFWRHIHTYIYRHRQGKKKKSRQAIFKKRKSSIIMEHHLLRQTYQEGGGRPECKCHEYFSFGRKNPKKNLKKLDYCSWGHSLDTPVFLRGEIIVLIKMLLNCSIINVIVLYIPLRNHITFGMTSITDYELLLMYYCISLFS